MIKFKKNIITAVGNPNIKYVERPKGLYCKLDDNTGNSEVHLHLLVQ